MPVAVSLHCYLDCLFTHVVVETALQQSTLPLASFQFFAPNQIIFGAHMGHDLPMKTCFPILGLRYTLERHDKRIGLVEMADPIEKQISLAGLFLTGQILRLPEQVSMPT